MTPTITAIVHAATVVEQAIGVDARPVRSAPAHCVIWWRSVSYAYSGLIQLAQDGCGDLGIVEGNGSTLQGLRLLVAFACNQNDVAGAGGFECKPDCRGTIHFCYVFCSGHFEAGQSVTENVQRILAARIV